MSDSIFGGIPSYVVAADNHNLGDGNGSILDPSTWVDGGSNLFKFTVAAATRAGVSTYNIVPTVANWFGADMEKASTDNVLRAFDDDLGLYYQRNQKAVDVVGDIGASIIPGIAGVKVLNWAQKGLALAAEGKAGWGLSEAFGLLPDKGQKILAGLGKLPGMAESYGAAAATDAASSQATFSWLNSNTIASLAAGYGQSALENAAFLTAAEVAMHDSPLFKDQDAKDIAYNALLGGGVVGGTIMGSLVAAKTYGAIKKAASATDVVLNPFKQTTQLGVGATHTDKILAGLEDLTHQPAMLAETDPLYNQAFRALEARNTGLYNSIRESVHELVKGDAATGNAIADSILGMDAQTAWENLPGLLQISRLGAKTPQAIKKLEAEGNVPLSTTFLKLHGESAGSTVAELPSKEIWSLADSLGLSSEKEVLNVVSKYKYSVGDGKTPLLAKTAQDAEARYIAASQWAPESFVTNEIDRFDIPALEVAFRKGVQEVTIKGQGAQFLTKEFLENTKVTAAKNLQELYPDMSVAEVAKRVNVSESYLGGAVNTANPAKDLFAMQTASEALTEQLVKAGLHTEAKGLVNAWGRPQYATLHRDLSAVNGVDGNVLQGMQYIKQQQLLNQQKMDQIFANFAGEKSALFDSGASDEQILKTTRYGAGARVASSSNSGYGTYGSLVENRGKATSLIQTEKRNAISDTFVPLAYQLKNKQEAQLELAKIYQQILQTPEKYVLDAEGNLVNSKIVDFQKGLTKEIAALQDTKSPTQIKIQNPEVRDFLKAWIDHNGKYVADDSVLLGAQGHKSNIRGDVLYFSPPNPKQFNHFAFVTDPSITGTGHVKMIWANSAAELEALAERVPNEFKVYFKRDVEQFQKAQQAYEYSAGINDNYFDAAFARKGVAAPFFPKTDGAALLDDMMSYLNKRSDKQVRDYVYSKYDREFKQMEQFGEQYTKLELSKAAKGFKYEESKIDNPYLNNIKTALNLSTYSEIPLLTQANRLAETAVTGLINKLSGAWAETGGSAEKLDAVNKMLKESGISAVEYDSALNALANHTAPKPVLAQFVRKANSILGTLMLRADPMNAINNGIGANVLLGAETRSFLKSIERAGGDTSFTKLAVPGTQDTIVSPAKLIGEAYSDWGKYIAGNKEMEAEFAIAKAKGWLPTMLSQQKEMLSNLAPQVNDTAAVLNSRISQASKWMYENADLVTGNRLAENMNRFVAYRVANKIANEGIRVGVIDAAQADAYINTFINRTQGNFLASQRPLMFQGPVGQAIGLFQTYQFNLLQQLFRYVSEGEAKNAAVLLGLQGSIYGMNGLPAFNAINTHIVGNAAGNKSHQDLFTGVYDVAGKNAGDWLLYGAGSNALGLLHPDLKTNLYSRGDINPRQVSVVPTSLSEVPIVSAAASAFSSLYNAAKQVNAGGNVWQSFLQGIEHSQISRPLAGLSQLLEATANPQHKVIVTNNQGNLVAASDLVSLANLGRLAGARPLDEAVMRDAMYRVSVYKEARNSQINTLGDAIKTKVQKGEIPSLEETNKFASEYAARGGNLQDFGKFYTKQIMSANTSVANTLIRNNKSPFSQYMQKIMGGYEIGDFNNSTGE